MQNKNVQQMKLNIKKRRKKKVCKKKCLLKNNATNAKFAKRDKYSKIV